MRKVLLLVSVLAVTSVMAVDTKLLFDNSDFEAGSLKNWKAEGVAFKSQPTKGDNVKARGREPSKHQGIYWIGTFEKYNGKSGTPGEVQYDGPDGKITSVAFSIDKKFINFLVGGGDHGATSVRLMVDGEEYYLASGKNSETLYAVSADVSKFKGKNGELVVMDGESGGWGHINADNFTKSDKAVGKVVKPVDAAKIPKPKKKEAPKMSGPEQSRKMKIDKRFIIIPIDNDVAKPLLSIKVDGVEVRHVTGPIASSLDKTDWWAFFEMSAFKGQIVDLTVGGLSDEGFKLITQSDEVPGSEDWGSEPKRPQFHFSQMVGWNNDPNGMLYYKGEYHLYLQHNPVGLPWGNMTWAHGISKNLSEWKQLLPHPLHHKKGDAMFSGGAAVDWKNTGGWKTGKNDVIIATWTSTGRGECIAYSNDKGRTFTEYDGNPIIKHAGRDPKPIWYEYGKDEAPLNDAAKELGGHWVIAVYDEEKAIGRNIAFYSSTDLKNWKLESNLLGYFECAELFELPVDGDKKNKKWVVFAADAKYAIGGFDGKTFTPEHEDKYQIHWGPYYASQCFSDAPKERVIQIGWARIGMKDSCFNQTFTYPTELTLRTTSNGIRMFGSPVKEIKKIHGKKRKAKNEVLNDETSVEVATKGALFDIRATFELGTAKVIKLVIDGREEFRLDCVSKNSHGKVLDIVDDKITVQILIDRPMKEMFINGGEQIITSGYENDLNIESVKAVAEGGEAKLVLLEVYELDAQWLGEGK